MAEAAIVSSIKVLLEKLISFSVEEISLFRNFGTDLKKLKDSAAMIQDFLEDAETKVVTDKAVTRWLRKLEAVAFDADYLFDELNYHHLRKEVRRGSKMKKKVRCFFPNCTSFAFRRRMARKIKDIEDELKSIKDEATELGLQRRLESAPALGAGTNASTNRETDSLTKDPVFIGRENDATKVVKMVINSPAEKVLSVIPIVGMGGLGKTTLAREVFDDKRINPHFENRIWVYVSENFVPETVFKRIFESLTKEKVDGSREVVLSKLKEKFGDKRYLLVLDDVWNENRVEWENFITPLVNISPPKGNVILLTTRNGNTASISKTNYTHELGVLSADDCWCVIKANSCVEDSSPPDFVSIGKSIATKCGGLPLAAKVVGSFLKDKPLHEWRSIEEKWFSGLRKNEDTTSKILRLSFDNLPSPSLKKCFAYSSVFPKGWWMEKDELIHLWMAEGLLQTHQETDMETVGNDVFSVLLGSSLLQVHERDRRGYAKSFIMHDLVHDLASSILNSKFHEGDHQVRYISKPHKDESSPISEEHVKFLRALFFSDKISPSLFSNLTRLHVLILNDGEMKELPMDIGKLICLRLLDISTTGVECLPDSIGDLFHLQILRATVEYGGGGRLRKLPHTIKFLANLRHLYIPNIELPPEIGKLISLQTLPFYRVSGEEGRGIIELGSLMNLKGEIEIHNLEKVLDKEEARNAKLFQKENILKLKLVWNEDREDDSSNDENVLEGLQPHRNLESLDIEGFKGSSFPSWTMNIEVGGIRLDNLIEIILSSCKECKEIPMMGHLPRLKYLYLIDLWNVECMGPSFYGVKEDGANKESMIDVFPALEKLELINMKKLSAWTEVGLLSSCGNHPRQVSVFRHLEYLKIAGCRELKCAPSHFPCLKELTIDRTGSDLPLASICGSKLTTLRKLTISDVDGMVCLPNGLFNNNRDLLELEIWGCKNLMHLVPCYGGGGASLRKLEIWHCESFERLPEDVHKLNALEGLRVVGCPNLKTIAYPSGSSVQGFTSLRELGFERCRGLSNLPLEMIESCALSLEKLNLGRSGSIRNMGQVMSIMHKMCHLRELDIHDVPIIVSDAVVEVGSLGSIEILYVGGSGWDIASVDRILAAFSCVGVLHLYGKEWDGLPDQLQRLTTLHTLSIVNFGIQVLPEWLERLSSLRSLSLWSCTKLRHLPSKKAMQGLTRLNQIRIYLCPLLKQNLEGSDDSEWSKVSHIPYIEVNVKLFSRPC